MELGEYIRRRRRELHLTQEQVAAETSMVTSSISHIEKGRTKQPGTNTLRLLARVLETTPEYLASLTVGGEPIVLEPPRSPEQILRELEASIAEQRATGPIRVREVRISAGAGEGVIAEEGVDYWPYDPPPGERGHKVVAVEVRGTCMEPDIRPGQRVYVDKDESPRPGDLVVAIHEGEIILRHLVGTNGDRQLVANKDHAPVIVTDRTIIFGVVKFIGQLPPRRRLA